MILCTLSITESERGEMEIQINAKNNNPTGNELLLAALVDIAVREAAEFGVENLRNGNAIEGTRVAVNVRKALQEACVKKPNSQSIQ